MPKFLGWFWVRAKKWGQTPKSKPKEIDYRVMPIKALMFRLKSGIWPILGLKLAIFATFFKISTSNITLRLVS